MTISDIGPFATIVNLSVFVHLFQERLFGDSETANYMNAGVPGQHLRGNSSLERGQHPSNLKTVS